MARLERSTPNLPRLIASICAAVCLSLCPVHSLAQTAPSDADAIGQTQSINKNQASPRDAMFAFLDAMADVEAGNDARWADVYRILGQPDPTPQAAHTLQRRAVKLRETLDYIGEVKPEELPGSDDPRAKDTYLVYFPQPFNDVHEQAVKDIGQDDLAIAMRRDDAAGGWVFDNDQLTLQLSDLHAALTEHRERQFDASAAKDSGQFIADHIPDSLKEDDILGVYYWQWIALALLILLAVIIDQALRAILRTAASNRLRKNGQSPDKTQLAKTVRPFGFVAAGIAIMLGLSLLGLPDLAYRFLYGAAAVFTVLAGIFAAWQLIDLIASIGLHKAEQTKTKFDDILVPMLRKAAKIFAVAIGIVYAAQALNLPIVPLLGSLGIGSLAFAFAAKDTIENFFGSVAVVLDRPFEVGDWVVIGDTEGTVEELGFRSTRIRTFYNSQITVPNATLVRATVDNFGRRKYRRWKTHVAVQYDTPPDKLIAFTEGIRELVRSHPYTRKDYFQVWMHQWAASSMDVLLYVFFEVPDWNTELRERERLFIDIVRLADKLGVQFAFPTQTVHLFKEERRRKDQPHEPAHSVPGASTDKRSMVQGIRTARELIKNQTWIQTKPDPVTFSTEGIETLLDEAGNETLVEQENKTEPTADTNTPNTQGNAEPPNTPNKPTA